MRCELELVRLGQRGNSPTFCRPTADGQIWLQDVDRFELDQVAEVEAGELTLTCSNGDRRRCADCSCPTAVVGADWFLEPAQPEGLDPCGKAFGLRGTVGAVCIDHQPDARTERGAGRGDPSNAGLDVAVHHADPHLDRGEAAVDVTLQLGPDPVGIRPPSAGIDRHVRPAGPTPELDDGCPQRLSQQIPQRHVDAADRGDVQAAPAERRKRPSSFERVARP